ncbi:hypothetical protein DICVIV_13758 [Dictyocaulus viviparus]|uniref:Uncharacterized protein n=1 Tax=Dictyocaulus viviparus TaxID=29172 RepID=A0A0D8X6Y6_DICVI|nr:hypothetical protein DICVIV_13758 [Dictyocaulus viviparus]
MYVENSSTYYKSIKYFSYLVRTKYAVARNRSIVNKSADRNGQISVAMTSTILELTIHLVTAATLINSA